MRRYILYPVLFIVFLIPARVFSQSATIDGTILDSNKESDIRAGGRVIDIALTDALWFTNVGLDNQLTLDLIGGFSGNQNWSAVIDQLSFTNVSRVNDTLVRISLPAVNTYYLSGDETISLTVPASCIIDASSDISATPDISIADEAAEITVSGSIQSGIDNTEQAIQEGGGTIILTLSGDLWADELGTNHSSTEALINGISGSASWDNEVISTLVGDDKGATAVSKDENVVTIELPAVPGYSISVADEIEIKVPAAALQNTSSGTVQASPNLTILPLSATATLSDPGLTESTLDGAELIITLTEETFSDENPQTGDYSHNGPSDISIEGVEYLDETSISITLGFSGDIDVSIEDFAITIPGSDLTGGNALTTNAIRIEAEGNSEITAVQVEDGLYGIGDTLFVLITVSDDGGNALSYSSGTVAGRELTFVQRESPTSYRGGFVLEAIDTEYTPGSSIPVTALVLSFNSMLSNAWSGNSTGEVTIDLSPPVIDNMRRTGATAFKVGEYLDIIVTADGPDYTAVDETTRVNDVPLTRSNVSFFPAIPGSSLYKLRYQVKEGDNDVLPGELTASLQIQDEAGNKSEIETTILSNTATIDANSPKVNSIYTDDGTYSIGDVIEVFIDADGNNYTATNDSYVNGVFLASSAVSFSYVSDNTYKLSYIVRNVDPEVLPGELDVVVYLQDGAGNVGGPFSNVEANNLSIYTALPSALLTGNPETCEGEAATITISLTGRAPWQVYLSDGNGNKEVVEIASSPYFHDVFPLVNTVYTIDSVVDVKGTRNIGSGSASVTVLEKTNVEIVNLSTTFYREADPVDLQGNPPGGTFSGPGVSNDIFDPGVADTLNSPHTLYYTYTNGFGCVSVDSALVFVLGAQGDVFIPKPLYCDYDDAFTVTGSNVSDVIGQFKLLNSAGAEVEGLTDNEDNTASIDPSLLEPADYKVQYSYTDVVTFTLFENFSIEVVEQPEILTSLDTLYCQNFPAISLESSVSGAVFEGTGITGDTEEGFFFNPSLTPAGETILKLVNTSSNGCRKESSIEIDILGVPELNFSVDKLCVSDRDTVFFTNLTQNKDVITEWKWIFDDPESGEDSISEAISPYHIFDNPGTRELLLIATTTEGCIDTLSRTIQFGDNPRGTFVWDDECYAEGKLVKFSSEMRSSNEITQYEWTILHSGDDPVVYSGEPEIEHEFAGLDEYTVSLYAETEIGCNKTLERNISLKPTITITDSKAYSQNFTGGSGWWSVESSERSDYLSWKDGMVEFDGLNGNESLGWFTQLPAEAVFEESGVKSPCFDFSQLHRPMISMDIHRSMLRDDEGVVLQATRDGGKTWKTVGSSFDGGINWYNSNTIDPGPAGQAYGWTGKVPFEADFGWITAKNVLDDFAGENSVQLRFVFKSEHLSSAEEREGFAFDNLKISERQKKVLLEHFTNTSAENTRVVNGIVNNIYNTSFDDAVKLEYHTSYPGTDPFNQHNSAVPATRSFYYSIPGVPYSLLDGGKDNLVYEYQGDTLQEKDIIRKTLSDPAFDIGLNVVYSNNQLSVDVGITANQVMPQEERILQVVVYEKLISNVNTVNGARNFINVVKDMLPNSAGTSVFTGWNSGQTRSYQFSWDYENVYESDMIRVAAFFQNQSSREVYQVVAADTSNLNTSIEGRAFDETVLYCYPNPANTHLNIAIQTSTETGHTVSLYDQSGRLLLTEKLFPWQEHKVMDVSALQNGIYFIKLSNSDGAVTGKTEKIIIYR